jgi:hypothetical protein
MGNITSTIMPQDCHICPHHFPVSLLEWRRNNSSTFLTTPLSRKVASDISLKELSYISLSDANNSVFHLHNHRLAKVDSSRKMLGDSHQEWFVQSLITTRDEIYSLFKSINRGKRKIREYTCKESRPVKKKCTRILNTVEIITEGISVTEDITTDLDITMHDEIIFCNNAPPGIISHSDANVNEHIDDDTDILSFASPVDENEYNKCHEGASLIKNKCTIITMSELQNMSGSEDNIECDVVTSCNIRPPTPPIIPSVTELHDELKEKFKRLCGDVELFATRSSVKEIAKILTYYHQSKISVDLGIDKQRYTPCASNNEHTCEKCQFFTIHRYHWHRDVYCETCKINERIKKRKVSRAVTSPTRMRPYASLTEEGKEQAFVQRGAVTRNAKQKYSRLIGKLANKKRNLVFGEDTPARKVMQQVVTYLKENLKQTDIHISRLMMDLELKDEYGVEVQREERTKCSQYLSETITNMTLHFNDKSKRQR